MKWIQYTAPVFCLAVAMAQPPDNSKVNKRDAEKGAVTAETQSNKKADLDLTRNIRRDITNDKEMSSYAKNIKIISRDGAVTLRGPVKSTEEKQRIDSIAKKAAGDMKVDNQLEITPDK
jgi:osmotically-inducible protein OsmY